MFTWELVSVSAPPDAIKLNIVLVKYCSVYLVLGDFEAAQQSF